MWKTSHFVLWEFTQSSVSKRQQKEPIFPCHSLFCARDWLRHSNVYYIIKFELERYFFKEIKVRSLSLFPHLLFHFLPIVTISFFFGFHINFDKTFLIAGSVTDEGLFKYIFYFRKPERFIYIGVLRWPGRPILSGHQREDPCQWKMYGRHRLMKRSDCESMPLNPSMIFYFLSFYIFSLWQLLTGLKSGVKEGWNDSSTKCPHRFGSSCLGEHYSNKYGHVSKPTLSSFLKLRSRTHMEINQTGWIMKSLCF